MRARTSTIVLAAFALPGCGDGLVDVPGSLEVSVSTTGGDLDPDGYVVTVDGALIRNLTTGGTSTLTDLAAGPHSVELGGLADNCSVVGANPVTVTVAPRASVGAAFEVVCVATGAQVVTTTSGVDQPTSYVVAVDGGSGTAVSANGTVRIGRLAPGAHTVELLGASANCSISGQNPLSVTIAIGETVSVAFSVACVAVTASIEVKVSTTGLDLDQDGYLVLVDGVWSGALGTQGSVVLNGASAGDHTIALGDVAGHCSIAGDHPRSATVSTGAMTRDTARVAFEVDCGRIWSLAFTRIVPGGYDGDAAAIYLARVDGSDATFLTWGDEVSWSPDGSRMVFTHCVEYSSYYYGTYCYESGLAVAGTHGETPRPITTNSADEGPAWSPDGARIAFTRGSRLFLADSVGSGSAPVALPTEVDLAADPSWSPDGLSLAFTCEVETGNQDVCRVDVDGTGYMRLTTGSERDAGPAWSPNGAAIAFATTGFSDTNEIAVMSPDGTGVQRLAPGVVASGPEWSADGATIVFTRSACDVYDGCTALGLFRIDADGSGLTQLTDGNDRAPAWRR